MGKVLVKQPSVQYFYPWPLVLVSCVDERGKPNIITIGASSICSSNPPTVGIAVGVGQYSLSLINATRDFGVNIPNTDQLFESDYCGSVSGRNLNKFEAAELTPQPPTKIKSPLILECPVSMECKLVHTAHLGNHDWLIGEMVAVHVDEAVLDEQGNLDCDKAQAIFCFWGEYWDIGKKLADWHYSRQRSKR